MYIIIFRYFFLHFDRKFEHILIKQKSMHYWIILFKALKFSRLAQYLFLCNYEVFEVWNFMKFEKIEIFITI